MMGETEQIAERGLGASLLAAASGPVMRWALVPLAGVALAPVALITTGTVGGASIAAVLANPLTVLAARSPGERPRGPLALSKTKMAREDERKLADLVRRTPGPGGAPGPYGSVPGPAGGPLGDAEPVPGGYLPEEPVGGDYVAGPISPSGVPGPGPIFATDTIPGTGGTIGGGGGGGTTPVPPTTVVPETPAPAIPEPATWLTMILGFGMIGGVLRSRRERAMFKGAFRPRN